MSASSGSCTPCNDSSERGTPQVSPLHASQPADSSTVLPVAAFAHDRVHSGGFVDDCVHLAQNQSFETGAPSLPLGACVLPDAHDTACETFPVACTPPVAHDSLLIASPAPQPVNQSDVAVGRVHVDVAGPLLDHVLYDETVSPHHVSYIVSGDLAVVAPNTSSLVARALVDGTSSACLDSANSLQDDAICEIAICLCSIVAAVENHANLEVASPHAERLASRIVACPHVAPGQTRSDVTVDSTRSDVTVDSTDLHDSFVVSHMHHVAHTAVRRGATPRVEHDNTVVHESIRRDSTRSMRDDSIRTRFDQNCTTAPGPTRDDSIHTRFDQNCTTVHGPTRDDSTRTRATSLSTNSMTTVSDSHRLRARLPARRSMMMNSMDSESSPLATESSRKTAPDARIGAASRAPPGATSTVGMTLRPLPSRTTMPSAGPLKDFSHAFRLRDVGLHG